MRDDEVIDLPLWTRDLSPEMVIHQMQRPCAACDGEVKLDGWVRYQRMFAIEGKPLWVDVPTKRVCPTCQALAAEEISKMRNRLRGV